jgi:hypothetical protein
MGGHAKIASAEWGPLKTRARSTYAPILLVANRSSHDVSFVDLARGEVVARVATGEGPHLLSNVSDGRVVATGYGEFPKPNSEPVAGRPPFVQALNSRLTLIDSVDRKVLLDTTIEGCAKPHVSWIAGTLAYVTCELEGRVLAIDLDNGRTTGRFDTLQNGSHFLVPPPHSSSRA